MSHPCRTPAGVLSISALLIATGCSHPGPTVTATSSAPPPFAIPHPIDTSSLTTEPCRTIPAPFPTQWSLSPGQPTTTGVPAWQWRLATDPTSQPTLRYTAEDLRDHYTAAQHPRSDNGPVTTIGRLNLHPAIFTTTGEQNSCDVAVAVAAQKSFHLSSHGPTTKLCAFTTDVAGAITAPLTVVR
ncbi:DUF3558 family protein [Amycolatopsis sp. PS_44_ISF1]|uniref:DUF3558 family protein n=1 Tax=Amycolatopsis sp. PS_44_ISF1 TaxID=2974917 RepID=UPI0028DF89C0|nr:DUF3558 family protein [Amycolatopsis sp. PS_44_ISF1]MDT8913555.1 DUF3558 family protein [Amycolatopsis sp. PS_44_ISF1]